jgi:phage gp46-like protein
MDFATILNTAAGVFDWAIEFGDLQDDLGLDTAVIISLFSDRLASPDDIIPDGSSDRRGWWGDAYLPPLADGTPDLIGSRLWLLQRAKQEPSTAQAAQTYVQEALAWLVSDGIAAAVTVPLPTFPSPGFIDIPFSISQATATNVVNRRYALTWNLTRATPSFFGIVQ